MLLKSPRLMRIIISLIAIGLSSTLQLYIQQGAMSYATSDNKRSTITEVIQPAKPADQSTEEPTPVNDDRKSYIKYIIIGVTFIPIIIYGLYKTIAYLTGSP